MNHHQLGRPAPQASRQYDLSGPGQRKGCKKLDLSGRGRGERSGVVGLGEFHNNRGAYTRRAGEMHSALMTVDNLLTDRQTQTGTALPLSAVERLKGTRQDL